MDCIWLIGSFWGWVVGTITGSGVVAWLSVKGYL